jgi:hypothetical protein
MADIADTIETVLTGANSSSVGAVDVARNYLKTLRREF